MKSRIFTLILTSLISLSAIASQAPPVKVYNLSGIYEDNDERVVFGSIDGCRYFGKVKVTKIKSILETIIGPDIKSEIYIDGKDCGEGLVKVTFVSVYDQSNRPRQLDLAIPAGTKFLLYDYSNSEINKK